MVHALKDIWRSLTCDGVLIDLRPIRTAQRIELIQADKTIQSHRFNDEYRVPNDKAADTAIARVQDTFFHLEARIPFVYEKFFDNTGELVEEANSKSPPIIMAEDVLQALSLADTQPDIRIRYANDMLLNRYRKIED